jgi:hypothetical protein
MIQTLLENLLFRYITWKERFSVSTDILKEFRIRGIP